MKRERKKNEDEKWFLEGKGREAKKKSHINENAIRAKHKSCRRLLQHSKWSTNSDSCQEVSGRAMHLKTIHNCFISSLMSRGTHCFFQVVVVSLDRDTRKKNEIRAR